MPGGSCSLKQYYSSGCSLAPFEHDSDAVGTEALAPRSASITVSTLSIRLCNVTHRQGESPLG